MMTRLLLMALLLLPGSAWGQQAGIPLDDELTAEIGGRSAELTVTGGGPELRFIERTTGADRPRTGIPAAFHHAGGTRP